MSELNISENTIKRFTPEVLNKLLSKEKESITIYPSQDFKSNIMWYGFKVKNNCFLINSNKIYLPMFPIDEVYIVEKDGNTEEKKRKVSYLKRNNIEVTTETIDMSGFSPVGIQKFMDNIIPSIQDVHNDTKSLLKTYVYFDVEVFYDFISLWIIGTYMFRCFRSYPYLHIQGEKQSGKTTLLDVITPICFNALSGNNFSMASFFRLIEQNCPTLLIDEFEKYDNDLQHEIITVLNSGYKSGGKVFRCDKGDNFKAKSYSTYSPKILAGINDIYNVLNDRCIKISMQKSSKKMEIKRFKVTDEIEKLLTSLRDDLYLIGLSEGKNVRYLYNTEALESKFPSSLSSREIELWEPIFILAKLVDDEMLDRIREMSSMSSKERAIDNIDKNFSYKFVHLFASVINSLEPIKRESQISFYDRIFVLNELKQRDKDIRNKFETMHKFTTYLKDKLRLEEVDKNITSNKQSLRGIGIPNGFIDDLVERFNLISTSEQELSSEKDITAEGKDNVKDIIIVDNPKDQQETSQQYQEYLEEIEGAVDKNEACWYDEINDNAIN